MLWSAAALVPHILPQDAKVELHAGVPARLLRTGDVRMDDPSPREKARQYLAEKGAVSAGADAALRREAKLADARAAAMAKKDGKASTAAKYLALRRKQQPAQAYLASKKS